MDSDTSAPVRRSHMVDAKAIGLLFSLKDAIYESGTNLLSLWVPRSKPDNGPCIAGLGAAVASVDSGMIS